MTSTYICVWSFTVIGSAILARGSLQYVRRQRTHAIDGVFRQLTCYDRCDCKSQIAVRLGRTDFQHCGESSLANHDTLFGQD